MTVLSNCLPLCSARRKAGVGVRKWRGALMSHNFPTDGRFKITDKIIIQKESARRNATEIRLAGCGTSAGEVPLCAAGHLHVLCSFFSDRGIWCFFFHFDFSVVVVVFVWASGRFELRSLPKHVGDVRRRKFHLKGNPIWAPVSYASVAGLYISRCVGMCGDTHILMFSWYCLVSEGWLYRGWNMRWETNN